MLLDVGCGEGIRLIGQVEYCVGIDIVEARLRRAKEELPAFGFVLGDVQYLPFKNEVFDKALCSHIIEHVHQPKRLLQEVHRVTKGSGFLQLEFPNGFSLLEYINRFLGKIGWSRYTHLHRFSPGDVCELLKEVGWVTVDVKSFLWLGPVIDSIYFRLRRALSKDPDRTSQRYRYARVKEINRFRIRKPIEGLDRVLVKAFPSKSAIVEIIAKKA